MTRMGMNMDRKMLVVDDDLTNRMVVRLLMERRGYQTYEASSGQDALDLMMETDFDVVLMDLSMPVMDGFEATRRLRALPCKSALAPVVALTAHTTQRDKDACVAAGMNGFLPKPFDAKRADQLLSLLNLSTVETTD